MDLVYCAEYCRLPGSVESNADMDTTWICNFRYGHLEQVQNHEPLHVLPMDHTSRPTHSV